MKRTVYIIGAIALILVLGWLILRIVSRGGGEGEEPGGGLPPVVIGPRPATSTLPQEPTIQIPTPSGSVTVSNFYRNPVEVNSERDALIRKAEEYNILYFAADGSFLIRVAQAPFETSRRMGEEELIRILGIAREEACRLNVSVTVPVSIDAAYGGKVYDLSFCR